MDDLQRHPRDGDRDALTDRIIRAHDEGRIGATDRDLRLGNVRSAQSMAELDLIRRELDQLDAALPPAVPSGPLDQPATRFDRFEPSVGGGSGQVPSVSGRALAIAFAGILAVALVVGGVARVSTRDHQGGEASPGDVRRDGRVDPDPDAAPAAGPPYSLTGAGIRGFLQTYAKRFGTTEVVELTLYSGYVIVNVPVPGKARQSGWLFRDNTWTAFGGVRAVFPGARVLDTEQLAIPALLRNIKQARATLNVEEPAQTYVVVRSLSQTGDLPSVDIHVANEFRESGYLATRLDGRVVRAHPYAG